MIPMLRVSFWGWIAVEVVVVAGVIVVVGMVKAAGVVEVAVVGGGRSRGAGTGGTEPVVVVGVTVAGTADGGWCLLARLPVRMLQRLSDELLRPDWLFASLPWSCWSR